MDRQICQQHRKLRNKLGKAQSTHETEALRRELISLADAWQQQNSSGTGNDLLHELVETMRSIQNNPDKLQALIVLLKKINELLKNINVLALESMQIKDRLAVSPIPLMASERLALERKKQETDQVLSEARVAFQSSISHLLQLRH